MPPGQSFQRCDVCGLLGPCKRYGHLLLCRECVGQKRGVGAL